METIANSGTNKVTVVLSPREYKKFLAFKEADRIAGKIRRGLNEIRDARAGKRSLKSAYDLANEF